MVSARWRMIAAGCALALAATAAVAAGPATTHLGIAVTPRQFPEHTPQDVRAAFATARELADHAVFIYQWSELDLADVRRAFADARRAGLEPILGLSPTTLTDGRKNLDLPADVRVIAGRDASFDNPVIREAFRDAVRELARLKPAYLCLATEINFLALQRLDEYLRFASLYKEAYREAKPISPATLVFVSFQWEWMRILDAREPHRIGEHAKVVDIFRPELDLVALTTYPAPFHADPADLPADYYAWVNRHIRPEDRVLLMEVGWPTAGAGSEAEQAQFIRRLPQLLRGVNVIGIDWALLHDVRHPALDANLATVGLLTNGGAPKPGLTEFRALRGALAQRERSAAQ